MQEIKDIRELGVGGLAGIEQGEDIAELNPGDEILLGGRLLIVCDAYRIENEEQAYSFTGDPLALGWILWFSYSSRYEADGFAYLGEDPKIERTYRAAR